MPAQILPAYPGYGRLLSTSLGTSLGAAVPAFVQIPPGIDNLSLLPRNFTTAVVAKISLNPFITVLSTQDGMATNPLNQSAAAQDGATGTLVTLSSLPTLANGGAVYVGANAPFLGLSATVVATNSGGGTMAVTYWNGTAWTNITPSDATTNMSASGFISWTIPTDWTSVNLQTAISLGAPRSGVTSNQFWVRIATSAVYDASVTLSSLLALGQFATTGGFELPAGEIMSFARGDIGNISALVDAGTGFLVVNGFFGGQ